MVSLSLRVKVLSFTDWKSTVIPSGVPSSSFLEYRLPILAEESSTRLEIPSDRNFWPMRCTNGLKSRWEERGTRRTFVGAMGGGNERTCSKGQYHFMPSIKRTYASLLATFP